MLNGTNVPTILIAKYIISRVCCAQVRVRRRLVRSGVLAPVQRVRREPAQLFGRVDVRAGGRRVRVRLPGRPDRQALRPGRAALGRPVPGQAVVPVRVHGRAQRAAVQRRAGDQTDRGARDRVPRQTRRRAQEVFVSVAVRRRAGTQDIRPRYIGPISCKYTRPAAGPRDATVAAAYLKGALQSPPPPIPWTDTSYLYA